MKLNSKSVYLILLSTLLALTLQAQEGVVTISQDDAIDKLLEYKKDIKTSKVFKIQVYNSIDPDKAQREKANFLNSYNEWPVEIVWNTPNYKVWVGNFATRLEADRALVKIKKKYMYANILQPKTDD
ncbi:sporulation related protein [Winogradskyella eximia]|jgi:SPOR domain|uniref:Sporulation related protein n=1 Tax=Winogradskyella eximia TaxID=262006 RepID=A0A3D9H4E6_9FLAO|nr:SPOR domain-containing protein [Winogradskyella eximia]RED44368.1 sporulation related protein [Winogradskyella eximia]|tara:strand:- start:681 stop:1061 length:381 start_codon:yes stop_codon:yes gene_type:complete